MAVGNNALTSNPPNADISITTRGSNWLWAVTALFGLTTMIFSILSLRVPKRHRFFYYLSIATVAAGTIAYYTLASNLGNTPVAVEFIRSKFGNGGMTRQFNYVRWIFNFISFPLKLIKLMRAANARKTTILFSVFLMEVFVVSLLIGALIRSAYKWGYFVIALLALFAVVYNLFTSRKRAVTAGSDVSRHFTINAAASTVLWMLYPVAWALSEGGNTIHPDSEAIFYGVLDILLFIVLGFLFLWGHRSIDHSRLGFRDDHGNHSNYNGTEKVGGVSNHGGTANHGGMVNNGGVATHHGEHVPVGGSGVNTHRGEGLPV